MMQVWIYQSALHIIPVEHVSKINSENRPRLPGRHVLDQDEELIEDEGAEGIDLYHALSVLRDTTVTTKASNEIQKSIWTCTDGQVVLCF